MGLKLGIGEVDGNDDGVQWEEKGNSQPNIRLSKLIPKEIRPAALPKHGLDAVQVGEEPDDVPLVGLLRGGEAALVHAVVDAVVRPLADLVDAGAQVLGVEVDGGGKRRGQMGVEDGAEHAQDLAALVVHDRRGLLVVENRHREAPCVRRVRGQVDVAQVRVGLVAWERVRDHVLAGCVLVFWGREAPAWVDG